MYNSKKVKMREFLIQCAVENRFPTYAEVAHNAGFKRSKYTDDFGPYFIELLMEIGEDELNNGRPMLNVLPRNGNFPSHGFYVWYTSWFRDSRLKDIKNNKELDESLTSDCFSYWQEAVIHLNN